MQKVVFNIQLTAEEVENLIQVLTDRIEQDKHDGYPAQKIDINLRDYFTRCFENKRLEDESPF